MAGHRDRVCRGHHSAHSVRPSTRTAHETGRAGVSKRSTGQGPRRHVFRDPTCRHIRPSACVMISFISVITEIIVIKETMSTRARRTPRRYIARRTDDAPESRTSAYAPLRPSRVRVPARRSSIPGSRTAGRSPTGPGPRSGPARERQRPRPLPPWRSPQSPR